MYRVLRIIFYLPLLLLLPTKVVGKKNIDKKGKFIIACNHMTYLDFLVLGIHINRKIHFIAKKELSKNRFIKWFFKKMGVISVDRDKIEPSTYKEILKVLKEEKVICIFPEGTRNKKNELMLPFKEGVTIFAEKTNTPIIPIVFKRKPLIFVPNKMVIGERIVLNKGDENNLEILRNTMVNMRKKEIKKYGKNDTRND